MSATRCPIQRLLASSAVISGTVSSSWMGNPNARRLRSLGSSLAPPHDVLKFPPAALVCRRCDAAVLAPMDCVQFSSSLGGCYGGGGWLCRFDSFHLGMFGFDFVHNGTGCIPEGGGLSCVAVALCLEAFTEFVETVGFFSRLNQVEKLRTAFYALFQDFAQLLATDEFHCASNHEAGRLVGLLSGLLWRQAEGCPHSIAGAGDGVATAAPACISVFRHCRPPGTGGWPAGRFLKSSRPWRQPVHEQHHAVLGSA